jgi:putative ABC transport system permease protein
LFTTRRRAGEIAIRRTFGSSVIEILILINRTYVIDVALAIVIATPVTLYLTEEWLATFVYRIPTDYNVYLISGGLALIFAVSSVTTQAYRATCQNPTDALRE